MDITGIPDDIKEKIKYYFTEYHVKDCILLLPKNLSDTSLCENTYTITHIQHNDTSLGINIVDHMKNADVDNNIANQGMSVASVASSTEEDKLKDLIAKYISRLSELINQNKNKSLPSWKHKNFISSISHQIKTPLNAMISGVKLIKHYTNDEFIYRILDYMNQSSADLSRYLSDIIDYYYLKQNNLTFEYQNIELADVLDYIYNLYKIQITEANIKYTLNIHPNVPKFIYSDETRVVQILVNLIGNAVKFTCHPTEYEDEYMCKYITCNAAMLDTDNSKLEVVIQDSGIGGINLDMQDHYFLPFNQTDQNWLSAPDGIGLGLCLSREIARKLGGDIIFTQPTSSQYITEIRLILPISNKNIKNDKHVTINETSLINLDCTITPSRHTDSTTIYNSDNGDKSGNGDKGDNGDNTNILPKAEKQGKLPAKIVLIDDNSTNIELLELIIKKFNLHGNIYKFTDSIKAYDYICANHTQITHILIDIKMPRKNGIEIIDDILFKYPDTISHTKIIFISALNKTDIEYKMQYLYNKYPTIKFNVLLKPIDIDALETLLSPAKNNSNLDKKIPMRDKISYV